MRNFSTINKYMWGDKKKIKMAAVLCPTLLFCSYVKSEVMIEIINFMRDYSERVNEKKK